MKWYTKTSAAIAILAVATLISPGAAGAAPMGGTADETVNWLRNNGYHVQINGTPNGPLSACKTTGMSGLRNSNIDRDSRMIDPTKFTTIYVDVSCNNTV